MKVSILEEQNTPLEVVIKCVRTDDTVLRLRSFIESFGSSRITARSEDRTLLVNACDILYFESVDNRIFLYTEKDVLETESRLYELEEMLSGKDFLRISKSQIVNVDKISALRPELNRTILLTLVNGEKLVVSRRYVKALRELLSI